jgi:WD40 repeat protein
MLAGMGNGSIYLWEKENCVKALSGHSGSVSSICARKDKSSFVSGDRSGNIIIWNEKF